MAKLNHDIIGKNDLLEYLKDYSDFSFEIQILKTLISQGFSCEHGGSYTDPTTEKIREFDIRATKIFGKKFLRLAVECKNIRSYYPLLISCLPRREEESFNEIVISVNSDEYSLEESSSGICVPAMTAQSKSVRLAGEYSIYQSGAPVGKACEQIGRSFSGKEIVAGDSEVYPKWSQALSSAHALTYLACNDGNERTGDIALSLVFPIVVVPDDRLWIVEYDSAGKRISDPKKVERCSYFINRKYCHQGALRWDKVTISHFEFLTASGLLKFVDDICKNESKLEKSFPFDYVIEQINSSK